MSEIVQFDHKDGTSHFEGPFVDRPGAVDYAKRVKACDPLVRTFEVLPIDGQTPDEPVGHRERHRLLHAMLDELLADYLLHTGGWPSRTSVADLLAWSARQAQTPDTVRP